MAVSMESAEPRMMMDSLIQDMLSTGRSHLAPTSPVTSDPGACYLGGGGSGSSERPASMARVLSCLKVPAGVHIKSHNGYVISRGFGMTSYVYLAPNVDGDGDGSGSGRSDK